ncbi:MAG TPA: histidine kinase [Gemmatimonadales bacterium]|nr:histidine kinase [Gemmatimonadales bacterium]
MIDDQRSGTLWRAIPAWLRSTVVLVAVWTVPVLIGSSSHFFGMAMDGGMSMPASHIWGHSMATWYIWIPATPLIIWLGRRYRFTRGEWPRALLVHLLAAGAVFLLQTAVVTYVNLRTGHFTPDGDMMRRLVSAVVNQYVFDLLTYAIVLSVDAGFRLAREARERDLRAVQLERQLAQARLEGLRMQLQPHFLFNTLNSAVMLVRQGANAEATSVLVQISELLRYVLDEREAMVPLREELHFLRRYLDLEQVRFRDRLVVEVGVPDALLDIPVPNLILQPIVENALRHGIGARAGAGHLDISARQRDGAIELIVKDDGPGLRPGWELERDAGVGLSTTVRRLEELYGGAATIEVSPAKGGGTRVRLRLPAAVAPMPAEHGTSLTEPNPAFNAVAPGR